MICCYKEKMLISNHSCLKATSDRKMKRNRSKSKPMSPDDYRKIEEDLQRQLQSGRIHQQRQEISHFTAMHDIMTGSFGIIVL